MWGIGKVEVLEDEDSRIECKVREGGGLESGVLEGSSSGRQWIGIL